MWATLFVGGPNAAYQLCSLTSGISARRPNSGPSGLLIAADVLKRACSRRLLANLTDASCGSRHVGPTSLLPANALSKNTAILAHSAPSFPSAAAFARTSARRASRSTYAATLS